MAYYTNYWRIIVIKIDLHIHSSLSACGENILSPQNILKKAEQSGLNLIAITDHNATTHSVLLKKIRKNSPVNIIMGIELTTREEIHLLAYFPDEESMVKMERKIDECLPRFLNNPSFFGDQLVYNQYGEIIEIDHLLRQNALQIGLDEMITFVHSLEGIAIPAHINRDHASIKSQIGFLDPDSNFDAVEVTRFEWLKKKYKLGDLLGGFPVISGSDSHFLEDIGSFFMELKDNNQHINDFLSFKKYLRKIKIERFSRPPF